MNAPRAVYRVLSADGRLLYVGSSPSPLNRAWEHSRKKAWGTDIATITVTWFQTAQEAFEAEAEMIRTELPEWNVHHRIGATRARGVFAPGFSRNDRSTWICEASQ